MIVLIFMTVWIFVYSSVFGRNIQMNNVTQINSKNFIKQACCKQNKRNCFEPQCYLKEYKLFEPIANVAFRDSNYSLTCPLTPPYTWFKFDYYKKDSLICNSNQDCILHQINCSDAGLFYCNNRTHAIYFELGVLVEAQCNNNNYFYEFCGSWQPCTAKSKSEQKLTIYFNAVEYDGPLIDLNFDFKIETLC